MAGRGYAGTQGKAASGRLALGRLKTGEMNKLETAFAAELDERKNAGAVLWWKFEGIKLRLADNTFLTPDFAVMNAECELVFYETKGFMHDDAAVKLKVAASLFPMRFILVRARPKKDGGGFSEVEV